MCADRVHQLVAVRVCPGRKVTHACIVVRNGPTAARNFVEVAVSRLLASRSRVGVEHCEQLLLLEHPIEASSLESLRVQLTDKDRAQRKAEADSQRAKHKAAAAADGAAGTKEAEKKRKKGASASDGDNGRDSETEQLVFAAQEPSSATQPDGTGKGHATARAIAATSDAASAEAPASPAGPQPTYSAAVAGKPSAARPGDSAPLVSIDEPARQTPKTASTGASGDATDSNPSDAVKHMTDAETTAAEPPEPDIPWSDVVACVTIEDKSLLYAVADVDDFGGKRRADAKALCLDAINCRLPSMYAIDTATIQALQEAFPAQLLRVAFDGRHQFGIVARKYEAGRRGVISYSKRSVGGIDSNRRLGKRSKGDIEEKRES